jgi:hypothetical protein
MVYTVKGNTKAVKSVWDLSSGISAGDVEDDTLDPDWDADDEDIDYGYRKEQRYEDDDYADPDYGTFDDDDAEDLGVHQVNALSSFADYTWGKLLKVPSVHGYLDFDTKNGHENAYRSRVIQKEDGCTKALSWQDYLKYWYPVPKSKTPEQVLEDKKKEAWDEMSEKEREQSLIVSNTKMRHL